MIILLNKGTDTRRFETDDRCKLLNWNREQYIITSHELKVVPPEWSDSVKTHWVFENDIQLASKKFQQPVSFNFCDCDLKAGMHTAIVCGPCSVETEEQIEQAAVFNVAQGIKFLRAGCFKPRTSPYTFQGLGSKGLQLLDNIRNKYGLKIVTEVRDGSHVDEVTEVADVIQIGAKTMYDHSVLKACAKTNKPVLLKRGFGTTLQEFVQCAEFVLSGGNENVILCERGIRTFETKSRFTLDLCGVEWLKENINLPVFVDPSHAMGYAYGVPALARAAMAAGVDGLLIEVHPNPKEALSDASQQLRFDEMKNLMTELYGIAGAMKRELI